MTIFVKKKEKKAVKQMLFADASVELLLYNLELHNSIAVVIKIPFGSVDICP